MHRYFIKRVNNAYIALGGNLGDVKANFDSACEILQGSCPIIAKSKLYLTPAVGPLFEGKQQPDYLNAVIHVSTNMAPSELLLFLHEIEAKHMRERIERWGARTLDLDLLAYENIVCENNSLSLPHPHISKRLFVLQPWADIQPDWTHPVSGLSIQQLIENLGDNNTAIIEGTIWTNSN